MNDFDDKLDVTLSGDANEPDSSIDLDNCENIKLILDLDTLEQEDTAQIEYESICPPIDQNAPEEFFYDDSMDLIEVEFKGARRAYFLKDKEMQLSTMDYVIVEAEKGVDLGKVYLTGDLVHIKRKGQVLRKDIIRKVVKRAEQEDLEKMVENRKMEENAFLVCRKKIDKHELLMKLVDVEYQYDRNRVTFFFTSDKRIDFRELVKDLAAEYRTRIELRQIGVRDEAKMIGGISSCGRELCCCTFLNDFKRITTQTAKIQMLQLNPVKLSGQCGRLKCCLMYELDTYTDSLKWFPEIEARVKTAKGEATVEKIDIFKDSLYLHYTQDDTWEKIGLHEFNALYHDQFPEKLVKECKCDKYGENGDLKDLEDDDSFMLPITFRNDDKDYGAKPESDDSSKKENGRREGPDIKNGSGDRRHGNQNRRDDRNRNHQGPRGNKPRQNDHQKNDQNRHGNRNQQGSKPQSGNRPNGQRNNESSNRNNNKKNFNNNQNK